VAALTAEASSLGEHDKSLEVLVVVVEADDEMVED
jgi:hypothetical protein